MKYGEFDYDNDLSAPRPTADQALMRVAYVFEARSTCDRNHVGAVFARDGRIISTGYNGAPAGMEHCVHPIIRLSNEGCKVSIHAESNAIAYAARHGVSLDGATAFVSLSPCYACAQLLISAGLVRVVFDRRYRDEAGIELLMQAGLVVERIS